jgi:hypothetical protein
MSTAIKLRDITIHPVIESQGPFFDVVAILPYNDLDASERFYIRLGFVRQVESGDADYRILANSSGGTCI